MKFNLESVLKSLGLPVGLVAVFAAVLALFGLDLDIVLVIAGSMIGLQALFSLLVDVLKWAGVVADDTAGVWSAVFNLLGLAGIAVVLGFHPSFDYAAVDSQILDVVKVLGLVFGYIVQVAGTKGLHLFLVKGLGLRAFSHSGSREFPF
ncbi:MAG: hypothetical protein KG029_20165 [Bacteroidetes bacterium]|nr:hypothetical protein [Bacteroidota bacterium]